MRLFNLIFYLFVTVSATAQTGNYFLSHYSPDEERFNIVCFDMVQDSRGVFYFATQAGILQFDGRNWDIIQTNGTIYSIAISDAGVIYAAGSKGFGRIEHDERGLETFIMLHEQRDAEYIFQTLTLTNKVYFLSDHNLFEFDPVTGKTTILSETEESGAFIALNEIFGTVYISTERGGILKAEAGKIIPATLQLSDSTALIFSLPHDGQYLLGTVDSKLFLCDPKLNLKEVVLKDSSYIQTGVIVNAAWVNSDLVAIGTLRGGVIFINPKTGETSEIINYNTGLPDNEVFNLITDRNANVWVAHAYGFTRISPSLPFRSFRYYPGLQGNLLCVTTYKDKVYVGTSTGLYQLRKEEFYDSISYFVDVPVRKVVTPKKSAKTTQVPVEESKPVQEVETKDSQKGGFFRFLKKKKPTETEQEPTKVEEQVKPDEPRKQELPQVRITYVREKRTRKILRSSYFAYSRIEGIDSKISQLIHWKGKLIASGLGGAYEVHERGVSQITASPVRFLFASQNRNLIVASTYDDRLQQYRYESEWLSSGSVENVSEPIYHIFEEGNAAIWFCGFDKVYRLLNTDTTRSLQVLGFNNPNFDKTTGLYLNDQVIIASPAGFFFYNRETQQLEKGDTLRKPMAYFANASNLWFRDKHNWYTAGSSGGHENLQLLNLFSNLRFIDTDGKGGLWIITGTNELLQFNSNQVRKDEVLYPLILKAIEHEDLITARNYLKIEQDESAFVVEVVKPDYIGTRFVEYRYWLQGLHQDWSEWSTQNNKIQFPYLPSGEYRLHVQSRDIFGRINDMTPVRLNVTPPYWKQPWFYAAEFSVFVFLVLLSFRLSYRFIFVSRLLSLLSIIMFIELIQTIAGETFSQSSPVIDFGIQVFIAMLILPVEGFLRRHLLQALAKRNEVRLKDSLGGLKNAQTEIPSLSPKQKK